MENSLESISFSLQQAIFDLLLQSPNCKLNQIFSHLKEQQLLTSLDKDSEQNLFKQNFLVMNALFNLQTDAKTIGYTVVIDSINIQLIRSQENQLSNTNSKLADYYLDLSNIVISTDEIKSLLDSFWHYYTAHNHCELHDVSSAFEVLGLPNNANLKQVKRAWYKIALASHPDKTSSHNSDNYLAANTAYQTLIKHFSRTK
ncbi:DNA-J related domain-containing protein [Pseudoalteromonas sp. SSM20]|uniref:DNA-J related domain-containing protein n=1 Tax=Pseudoalteromonas sp. SSM20 TaxID=3139394 RepID=UPI003BAC359B